MYGQPDKKGSIASSISGLYSLLTDEKAMNGDVFPGSMETLASDTQRAEVRQGLYRKLHGRGIFTGSYEDFDNYFFNPYSQGNQVEALRNKTFTQDPAKEMARRRALRDASSGQYNPFGTSEVSYRPEVRGLGTNIAPIDLVEEEDTMPEPKTPAGDLPKTTRTFWGGVVSGARGIHGGAQIAVADLLKGFGGNSDDEKEAIHLINQMEKDGTLSIERVRGVRERLLKDLDSYTHNDILFSGDYSKKARQLDALNLIEERMQRMGEDLSQEKRAIALDAMRSDLSEKGASEDKANPFVRWKEDAKDYIRKSEVPSGTWAELGSATASVGGALAGQAISLIPGVGAPIGQAISWASIGAQTLSSGGQAIMDMEDYAAEKGVYITPEEKATIAIGYMATEFGGDALGGAVAAKSISAIGKLAGGGRIGQKLAVRSLAKGIAGNEGVRQSLSRMSEYAQKPLAIPLAKSAGRQIVRGAVTEGPGESLTTLAQNGALDRVWKSKEDQEAWADVARQAVKDGIYGAWAGALMGGFGAGIQSGQVARMHRKEGLTIVQDAKNNLYEVIGADQSSYFVLDQAGRQKMLPADQVVDAIHYTPQARQKSQKAYDEATEWLHPKEGVLTENQKRAGAILSASEQQQSPIYRATHPEVAEEDLNSPVALAGAKKALADVLEGQNEEVKTRVDQMALVLQDGQADPTEELTKLLSDESLSDNDRQSILDVVTAQSRLATIERSHQEAMAQMQDALQKEWSAKSVVGDETARGAVISATITDADGKQKQVYVTGGVKVVTNEDGTVELLPTDDEAPIYVYDESVDGEEKGHIVQMDDLSSPQLVAEDYLDVVQASLDEAETAFRSEVQAADWESTKQKYGVKLSEEVDENGKNFVLNSEGEKSFGQIPEGLEIPAGDILLSEGDRSEDGGENYGLKHIEDRHGFQIRNAGYRSVVDFVEYVASHYDRIKRGTSRNGEPNGTYLLQLIDGHHNTIYVELSQDGTYWRINSAGVFNDTYGNNKETIRPASEVQTETPQSQNTWPTPNDNSGYSEDANGTVYESSLRQGKGTENSESEQFLSSLPRTREGEVDGLRLMSERPDDFIRYLGQLYGEDFVASLPLSKKGVLDLKALTPEQTLRVNEAALGKSGAVEAARQRRSQVGAERAKLEAEVKNDLGNLEKRMALRKASEEYRLYDDYVRTAEEQTRQEREAQKRAEEAALTPEERQRREEEKRQLAQEKKEREERIRLENERRRREREELERNAEGSTVREYTEDPPRQARTRGARLVNGAVVYRQEPMTVEHYADAERAFSQRPGETRVPVKRTIVEAESLQASHKEGRMNPKHFIPEAQPKDRADNGLSSTAADRIASDIRPDEITGGITAYTGAPVVNGRGEVIQGNNRTDALQTMYDGAERHAKSVERYKEYLKAHASEYGMTAEQVEAMAHPVAVDVAEVSDSEAIRLGHRGQTDLESAGTDTMNAQTVGEELNSDTDPASGQSMLVSFFNRIFNRAGANGAELSAKMDNMLNRNAEEGLKFLHENGYITDTQYKNAFETNSEGKRVVTAEAKTALKDVALYQLADVIGPRAMDIFYRLPASARNGLATFLYRDSQASFETSLAPDLGDALLVWDSLRQDPDFAGLTNFESAKIFILGKVSLFGRSELETNLGEASSLAKLLAASLQTQTEEQIADVLNQYYDLVGANETGAKTQSLMPTSQPTDTKAGAAEAVYGRVYEVPSGREKHYRFRRDVAEDFRARRDVAEDFRARRDALADRITEERRKRAAAADMARTFGVPMKLHEDMSTLPEEVRAGFDETHFVKGWFYKGDNAVHIYLPANVDADDVRATFLHEAVGHYGCRELLGEVGYNQVLDGIANKLGEEEVLRAMNEYCNGSQDLTDLGQVRIAMDEWIAHRAESGITKKTVWESIKDFFRKVFGLSGKRIDQSAEMMADDLLRRSAENLQKRAERQQGVATEEAEVKSEVRFRARKANGEEVDLPGVSYSDIRDHYGYRFVKASDGSIDFGEIGEETGLTPGKIRLSEGYQSEDTGYGLLHMERSERKEQILKAGFSSIINFVEYVAKNYTAIFKGKVRPSGKPTYILQAPTSKNNILYVELFPEEGYWDINSGGPFSFTYTKNKEIVWSLPALGHTIVTGGMELSAQQTGDSRSGNSPQTISLDDKGTESSVYNQKDESEKRFRRAERAGDVSGAAAAASDFMRNATPKNTSVDDVLRFFRVYHKSPHLLKKADGSFVDPDTGERLGFDHRFIGSGEGFQAHGWGSYFSVNDLAHYASTNDGDTYDGIKITKNDKYVISKGGDTNTSLILFQAIRMGYRTNTAPQAEDTIAKFVEEKLSELSESQERRLAKQKRLLDALKGNEPWAMTTINSRWGEVITDPKTGYEYDTTYSLEEFEQETYERIKEDAKEYRDALEFIERNPDYVKNFVSKADRHKYQVEIPDPKTHRYLEEGALLTKEEESRIREAASDTKRIKYHRLNEERLEGRKVWEVYDLLSSVLNGADKASALLNKAGFVGIHYNGRIDGECYVIFNENDAKITDHYRFRRTSDAERIEIERKAKADGSWLLAPDGTPSTLSEDGWIASRSSDFMAEYGDWEKSRNAKWLTSDEYVSEMGYFEFPHVGKTLIDDIAAYYLEKEEGHVERPGIGDILLDKTSVKNSYYHGVGANKITAFAIVPEVLKNGVQIDAQKKWKGRDYDTVMIAAPVSIEGQGYVCSVIVKQTTKNRFYLHELYLQKNLQESASSPGGKGQDAITSRVDSSLHPDLIANVLKEYVSHKDDLPESFYQANGEPKREIVEEYLRSEEEKEVRYRRVKADPMNAISPINPQWDGEWYSSEDLTGKSTADLLELPAAPAVPEKRPTQSVAEYAETMSRHYADPRVRFRTGVHKESLRAPQPPRITDGMSLYEVAQLQHEYNRNYRDYLSSSMKRMDALVTTKGRFIRYMVDSARPVELFCKEMERMGIGMTPEQNIYQDLMTQSSRELNMRKQEVEPLVTKLTDRIRDLREQKLLDKVTDVSYTFTDEDTNETKTIKRADGYDKVSLYFQAKDIVECEQLGLVSRGREGFEKVVTEAGKPSNHITPEAYIASFEASVGKANAEALCDDMRKMSRWSIDRLHGAGLMTDDQYRSLTQSPRRYYAPQRGFKVTEESDRNAYERVEMTAEGRQSLSGDPIAYMQAIMNTTVMRVVRNQDLLHLYEWVTQHQQELARKGVLEIGETYYRKSGVDEKGNPIYMPSKQNPTIEELRHDTDVRRQVAKLRMEQKRLDQSNAKGETADYVYGIKSKEISNKISDLNNSIEILYRDPEPLRGDEKKQDEALRRTVRVYKDGVEQQIHFSPQYRGELVADVLNGRASVSLGTNLPSIFQKPLNYVSKATRFMSALMTQYNPNFAVTNALRDYGTALISNVSDFGWGYQRAFMANYAKVQTTVLKYTMSDAYSDGTYPPGKYGTYLKEFFDEGAATGWSFLPDVVKIRQTMKEMSDPSLKQKFVNGKFGVANAFGLKQGIGMITEASELNTRFAEYVTSRERGYSKKEAAKHAKELTVNFNRKGTLAGVFGSFFGFWNASIQGTNKIVRLGKHGTEWCGTLFAGGLAQGLLYALGAPDKDDERAFTEWEMMTNICIGDLKIPLPQGFRGFWGAGVQMSLALAGKKDWQGGVIDGMQYLIGELLPSEAASLSNIIEWDDVTGNVELNTTKVIRDAIPTAVQPEFDVILNMDFMGNPVYREPFIKSQEGQIAQRTLGKKRTKQVYKDLSDTIWYAMGGSLERNDRMSRNGTHILPDDWWMNPSVIEHVFEGHTTGIGKTMADIATCVSAASSGDPSELRKLQIVNVLTKQEKDYSDSDRNYWKLMDFYNSRQQAMSNLRKAKEGEDVERYKKMTERVDAMAPQMTGEQLTEKIWEDGTKDEKLYVTWLETKALIKQIDKGKVTKEEVAPTIDRLKEQFRELR